MMWALRMLAMFAMIAGLHLQVQAHTQSVSYSVWALSSHSLSVSFRISQLELNRIGLHPAQADYTSQISQLAQKWIDVGKPCASSGPATVRTEAGQVIIKQQWQCTFDEDKALRINMSPLFDQVSYHTNLAAMHLPDGQLVQTTFNSQNREWTYFENQAPSGFSALFEFGLTHILTGWDHLLFLLVLLLNTRRTASLMLLVTGFTVGHSLTLALQVLGLVNPPSIAVEWVIALSILLVAMQNTWAAQGRKSLWPYLICAASALLGWAGGAATLGLACGLGLFMLCQLRWQQTQAESAAMGWVITLAFGLFHGFGFAGLLSQLQLPTQGVIVSLVAFNLGVEAGQVLALTAAIPILALLRRTRWPVDAALNSAAAAAATFWLVTRTF